MADLTGWGLYTVNWVGCGLFSGVQLNEPPAVRRPRIKICPEESEAAYHCITRTVNRERLIDDVAKEVLRRQMWQVADFCGVKIITYAILDNHFHVLLRVPQQQPIPDFELLRRYQVLYPKPTVYQMARLEVIKSELDTNGPEARMWRNRQLALMGDVSQFMKLLKQRFSIWFNRTHQRVGTLWAERFKSVLIEVEENALQVIAAYIDLNSVRAGLALDPMKYRFCGYAEAVAGNVLAQQGIQSITSHGDWSTAHAHYREMIFGTGAAVRECAASIPFAEFKRVLSAGGDLPLATVLRCRLRYFTDGAILGSRAFISVQLARYRQRNGPCPRTGPRALPAGVEWSGLMTLRALRQHRRAGI